MAACAAVHGAPDAVTVCVDYGCDYTRTVSMSSVEWQSIATAFADPEDADAERDAIARAIGALERVIGEKAGTAGDAPRNTSLDGRIGQLDCIAESMNTLAYLELLERHSLLTHHRVAGREVRRPLLFNTHWTAVVEEIPSGERYAVDSWYRANGEPAIVQSLSAWKSGSAIDDHEIR